VDGLAESKAATLIVRKENINREFFRLGSGFAGEMLQKISNYRKRLAIIGDNSKLQSKPLRDFIYESNKNGEVIFVASAEEALKMLTYVSARVADAACSPPGFSSAIHRALRNEGEPHGTSGGSVKVLCTFTTEPAAGHFRLCR
jgi:hypothetical protein